MTPDEILALVQERTSDHALSLEKPRIHPNGFIQYDLTDCERLHIWPGETFALPVRKPGTPIHDHPYAFRSFVLKGALRHQVYEVSEVAEGGDVSLFGVYGFAAVGRESPIVPLSNTRYALLRIEDRIFRKGEQYEFAPFLFHESSSEKLTVTVMRIAPFDKTITSRIVCPIGMTPDGSFRRDCMQSQILQDYILSVVGGVLDDWGQPRL